MTAEVMIKGQGPFSFVVDTGAERTVISSHLARQLELVPGPIATVHSMTEVSDLATVVIPALRVGRRTIDDIHAPALDARNLGAAGMLGIDSLVGQRIEFDFRHRTLKVVPSARRQFSDAPFIAVKGRRHFGRLLLTDASVDGKRVAIIVDSGSQITIGNNALRRALETKRRIKGIVPVEIKSITGGRIRADYGIVDEIRIGELNMRSVPISFAEVHPFRQLELSEKPALLLGMDMLQHFQSVSVDFPRRRIKFTLNGEFDTIGRQYLDPSGPRIIN